MSKKHHSGTHTPTTISTIGVTAQKYQNYFFFIPAVSSILAIAALLMWGLHAGIDLKGGSLLEVKFPDGRPDQAALQQKVDALGFGEIRIQPLNTNEYVLRQRDLANAEKNKLSEAVNSFGKAEEVQFNSVGPSIGAELMQKAWWAIAMITLLTIAFIAFAFRGVSEPVASWKYGVVAIITLLHDILIPTGLFAYLGHARGAEVGALFIVALLTILGISINDTIVVFDRIRENLNLNISANHKQEAFGVVVWRSIMQTLTRSINTSVTVIVMLVALFWYGPASTEDFSLTLIVGMLAGTYSSILVASPLLILIEKRQKKQNNEQKRV
jgi:preprotein translocase subunit SecF